MSTLLTKLQGQLSGSPAGSFKQESAPVNDELIAGVSVPAKIQHNGGNLRFYIHLSPSVLSSPEVFASVLDSLGESFDLDVWNGSSGKSGGFKKQYNRRW